MWKRDQQILDVYGIKSLPSQSKDDSLIVKTPSLYKVPTLSHSQPLLEAYTRDISSSRVYQGNEFDVFSGKQQAHEESVIEEKPHVKVLKRTSIDYLIDNHDHKKKRRTLEPSSSSISLSNDNSIITNPNNVFIKATAPANTPANFFMAHSEEEQEACDLEYY